MERRIYLDNNATTPIDPIVAKTVLEELSHTPANPSSSHFYGQRARQKLQSARDAIAKAIGAQSREIVFTSGGTEALNMLLRGASLKNGPIVSSVVEHAAVYDTLKALEKQGRQVRFLQTGKWGAVRLDAAEEALRQGAAALCLMAVNNETGVKTDIVSMASLAERYEVPFFVDGIASFGKEPFSFTPGIMAICFSAHKFHGPQGVGFAAIRQHLKWSSQMTGGGQELGRRSGTENMPGIVGMAKAVELFAPQKIQELQKRFEQGLLALGDVSINGEGPRICNVSNVCFHGVDGESLLIQLDRFGICASLGSACASGGLEPSRVLLNMGYTRKEAESSLRFSLSRMTTQEDIDKALDILSQLIRKMR